MIIIDSFSKIGNGQIVENLFPEQMIHDLSESHHFKKFGKKRCEKKHIIGDFLSNFLQGLTRVKNNTFVTSMTKNYSNRCWFQKFSLATYKNLFLNLI